MRERAGRRIKERLLVCESLATCFTLTAQSDHLTSCVLSYTHTHTHTHFEHSDTHSCLLHCTKAQPHLPLALVQHWENKDGLCLCFLLSLPLSLTHTHPHVFFAFHPYFTAQQDCCGNSLSSA